MLAQPQAEPLVATIIHEATHQIAFNCGLQTRFADIPLWVSEGIAVYFETPDLTNSKGWKEIGAVNRPRLDRFREYLTRRPADSLSTLISDDTRLRDSEHGAGRLCRSLGPELLPDPQPHQAIRGLSENAVRKAAAACGTIRPSGGKNSRPLSATICRSSTPTFCGRPSGLTERTGLERGTGVVFSTPVPFFFVPVFSIPPAPPLAGRWIEDREPTSAGVEDGTDGRALEAVEELLGKASF